MDNKLDKAPALLTTIGGLCMIATGLVGLGLMVAVVGAAWFWGDSDG
jgi:hypothetical protein